MRCITGIIAIFLLIVLCPPVTAGPVIPAEFYGAVTVNGDPAPAGTVITALINNQVAGTITTTAAGVYGGTGTFDPRLVVTGTTSGQAIRFQINGNDASQTSNFRSGTALELALSAEYASGVTTTTTTPATTATTTTAAKTVVTPTNPYGYAVETLVNPWTPVPTVTAAGTVTAGRPVPASTVKQNPGSAAASVSAEITGASEVLSPPDPTPETTAADLPVTEIPRAPTPSSPGLSFETMALLGFMIIAGMVLRK